MRAGSPVGAVVGDLTQRAGRVLPGGELGVLSLPGGRRFVADHGLGPRVWDTTGRGYVDLLLGSGALILGHVPSPVIEAVDRQLARGTTYYALSEPAVELAERLVEIVPCADSVRFCGTGSEATFFAMRLARAATGRDMILKFEGGFHGNNDYGLMGLSPPGPPRFPRAEPSSAGIPAVLDATVLVAPYNDAAAVERVVAEWSSSLAAIIVEPVQRAIPPTPGFLEALRRLATRHGIVLIFDEVVTGFRLALGGAQEYYGVTPDLAALGKALAAGFPLAAVVGRRDLMAHAAKKGAERAYFSGTLSGNPVSCSAALATIAALSEPGTHERLSQTGEQLRRRTEDALVSAGHAARVYGVGPMFQIHFGSETPTDYRGVQAGDTAKLEAFAGAMIDRGILYTGQKAYLSLAHAQAEIDEIVEAVADVAATLAQQPLTTSDRRR